MSLNPNFRDGSSKLGLLLGGMLAILLVILGGASIALLGVFGWIVWFAFAASLLALVFLISNPETSRDGILLVAAVGLFVLPLVQKTTGLALNGYWQVLLFGMALIGIPKFCRAVANSSLLALCVGFFGIYLALGLVSSYFGRSLLGAGLYQFLSDLKPLMLIVLGYALVWGKTTERMFWAVIRWFWIIALIFVVFGWASPGLYQSAFPFPGSTQPDPTGILPSRALGPFVHPSILATMSAVFSLLCFIRSVIDRTRSRTYLAIGLAYFLLLVCSVQRQELAAFMVAAAFAFFLARPKHYLRRAVVAGVLVVLGGVVFWAVFGEYVSREAASWGFNTTGRLEHPRAQIIYGAILLASRYFPLGSGLGTYGGAGAMKFDLSLYYELGFRQYWWFGKEDFLMDTYWPNSLAETGVIGVVCLAACFALLLLFATLRSVRGGPGRLYWIAAASGMTYMLALSFSSPGFQDPRLFLIPALMFGIAPKLEEPLPRRVSSEERAGHIAAAVA